MTEFKRIPPQEAHALREQGAVLVDVRDPQTFESSHIPDSLHLDIIRWSISSPRPIWTSRSWLSATTAIPARAPPPTW